MPLSSHLSTPPLVRLFQDWAVASGEPVHLGQSGRQDVAERLGEWLSAMGSVKLDGALQTIAAYGAQQAARPARVGQSVDGLALDAACRQVRADLAALIAQRLAQAPAESADYPPQLQLYQALQKQME